MSAITNDYVSLEEIFSKFPGHPLARVVPEWLASFNKTFQDVIRWEMVIKPFVLCHKAEISVQFADGTRLSKTFQYSQVEKGQDHGN